MEKLDCFSDEKAKFDDIIQILKKYNFDDLFLWFQVSSSHPSNQKYCARIDLMNALLLSIPSGEFEGNTFLRNDCGNLFSYLNKNYSSYFIPIEDFEPFDQLKLIPYFYGGEKYYFYYGIYESPFEELENFHNLYLKDFSEANIAELETIESSFRVSLEFQTVLLEKVTKIKESKKSQEKVYIPSQEYFNAVESIFEISQEHLSLLEKMTDLRTGDFNHMQAQLADKVLEYNLFQTFKIKTPKDRMLFLYPGRHIDVLCSFAIHLIKNSQSRSTIEEAIQGNSQKQLRRACRRFFTIRGSLAGLYVTKSHENLIKKVDFAGVTDGGKIILFKLLPINLSKVLDEQIIEASSEIKTIIKDMNEGDSIGLRYASNPQEIPAIPTSVAEIFMIYVIPKLTLDPIVFERPKDLNNENNFIVILNDIERVFEHLSSPLAFIKFMRDDNELKNKTLIFNTDFLDRFICYIDNSNTFSRQGKQYNFILFEPHSWSGYYLEKLYEKSKDDIYELTEGYFPGYFNKIKNRGGGVYTLCETSMFNVAYATKFNNGLIMASLPPDGYFCTGDEIQFSEFIAHFYAHYFNKFEKSLIGLFRDYEIHLDELYGISVMPVTYIKRNNIKHLLSIAAKVGKDNPIEIMTGRIKQTLNLRTSVVFDCQGLPLIFSQEDNQGEKDALCRLLISLLKYLKLGAKQADLESEVTLFVDKIMPVGPRAFSLDAVPSDNPKAERYREHEEPSGSDIARVQRKIAEHIASSGSKPGEYDGAKAIGILECSFDFISNIIEKELKEFNQSTVQYAFEQLEFVEVERVNLSIRAGVDSSKYVEYDVQSRFVEEYDKLSKAAISIKYLCTNIIKLKPCGSKAVDRESWDNILALANSAIDLSWLIDMLRYDLRQLVIKISEMYEISHDIKGDTFDIHSFAESEAQNKISAAQNRTINNQKDHKKESNGIIKKEFLENLDEAFIKQYKFKFIDMICVLFALGKYESKSSLPTFVNECSKESLLGFLEYEIVVNCPSRQVLNAIIDFVSIDKQCFNKGKIIPSQLFREKKRLNLCPIYCNEGTYVFGNQMCIEVSKFWMGMVVTGDFPYLLDKDSEIEKCMLAYRTKLDKELEKKAELIVREEIGEENYEANILNFKRLSEDFPKRPECGEIDLLAVNKKTKTLFLFDSKNRRKSVTPHGVKYDIEDFLRGKKSYLSKIIKKERFIRNNFEEILRYFSVSNTDGWNLKKAFIVNRNYQIAHYYKKSIDFIELDNLAGYLVL